MSAPRIGLWVRIEASILPQPSEAQPLISGGAQAGICPWRGVDARRIIEGSRRARR